MPVSQPLRPRWSRPAWRLLPFLQPSVAGPGWGSCSFRTVLLRLPRAGAAQGGPRGLAEPHLSRRGKPRPAPRRRHWTLRVAAFQPIGRPVRASPSPQLLGKFSARRNLPPPAAPLRAGPALELRGARPGSTLRRPARRRGAAAGKPYELSRKGVTKGTEGRGPSRPGPSVELTGSRTEER